MPFESAKPERGHCVQGAHLLCMALMLLPAWAFGGDWSAGIAERVAQESNPLRLIPELAEQADRSRTHTLRGALDTAWSGQSFLGLAQFDRTQYEQLKQLDHDAYALVGKWEGSSGDRLKAGLSHRDQKDRSDYEPPTLSGIRVLNEQRVRQTSGSLRWGGQALLAAELSGQRDEVDYQQLSYWARNYHQNAVRAGLRWQPLGGLSASVGYTASRGLISSLSSAQQGEPLEQRFQRRLGDLSIRWDHEPGYSISMAHTAGTRRTQDNSAYDGSVASWRLEWDWQAWDRLKLRGRYFRDRGSDVQLLNPLTASGAVAAFSARSAEDWRVEGNWEMAPRWMLTASWQDTHRTLSDVFQLTLPGAQPAVGLPDTGKDRTRRWRLGLQWRITEGLSLACGLAVDDRKAWDIVVPTAGAYPLTLPYRSRAADCSVRWDVPAVSTVRAG